MAIPRARGTWVRRARWAFLSIWRLEIRRSTGNEWYIVVHSGNSGVSDIRISVHTILYSVWSTEMGWDEMGLWRNQTVVWHSSHSIPFSVPVNVAGRVWGFVSMLMQFVHPWCDASTYIQSTEDQNPSSSVGIGTALIGRGGFSFMMTMAKCIRRRGKLQVVHTWSPVYP